METYQDLIEQAPSSSFPTLLEQGQRTTRGILGSRRFLDHLPARLRMRFQEPGCPLSLDQLVAYVARLHQISPEEIASRSRAHSLVIARVQVTWYATERAGFSLTVIARRLHRDASTLCRVKGRYWRSHPELFTPAVFAGVSSPIDSELATQLTRTQGLAPHRP